jgi:hypothetical protein
MSMIERTVLSPMFLALALLDPSPMAYAWLVLFAMNYWMFWKTVRHELGRVS